MVCMLGIAIVTWRIRAPARSCVAPEPIQLARKTPWSPFIASRQSWRENGPWVTWPST